MRFFHSGDFGDIIYAIPSMRGLCPRGAEIFIGNRDWTRSRWDPFLLSQIEPLLRSQSFVSSVTLLGRNEAPPGPFVDFSTFRNGGYKLGDTILERQRRWVQARADISNPWIAVEPDPRTEGKILVNRAERWHGFAFPWGVIVSAFLEHILFVGLPSEHAAFRQEFGIVDYLLTPNLLEVAKVLAGCEFFIGNQSACNALANGLHKPSLLEVCPYAPDCFLPRENASYCLDGEVDLELLGRVLKTPPKGLRDFSELEAGFLAQARIALKRSHCNEILAQ